MRRQPPAHSPITWSAIVAGARGVVSDASSARTRVSASLRADYVARDVLLVDSGTSALRLALAGAARGDRPVALPAYSCYDVATAAVGAGVKVLLYDLDPQTLGPDRESLRRVLDQRPAALVVAHLFGYPLDMDWLTTVSAEAKTLLIEDAAQAAGGRLHGKRLGSFGSLTVLSFGRGKGTTGGGGGALLAHDDAGAAILAGAGAALGTHAPRGAGGAVALAAQWLLGRPSLYWLPAAIPFLRLGETVYRAPHPPAPISGSAVRALERNSLPEVIGAALRGRIGIGQRLLARARASARVRAVLPIQGAEPGFLRVPVVLVAGERAAVVATLERYGVAGGYPTPLNALPELQQLVVNAGDRREGAKTLADRLVTLPAHRFLTEGDLRAIESWLG